MMEEETYRKEPRKLDKFPYGTPVTQKKQVQRRGAFTYTLEKWQPRTTHPQLCQICHDGKVLQKSMQYEKNAKANKQYCNRLKLMSDGEKTGGGG